VSEPARSLIYSFLEYVALEAYSNVRHEYRDGAILAKAGGTPEHAALCAAASGLVFQRIIGTRCAAHSSDLRVRVSATGLCTYPDVSVVCAPRELDPDDRDTVLNPKVLIEVTSPSSEEYDLGEKRENYLRIASLREYVVILHRERRIEVWFRSSAGWATRSARSGESVRLDSLDLDFDVDRLYDLAAQAS
jgi:Uma2 family endonuclease